MSMWNFPSVIEGKVKLDFIYFDWISIYFRTFGGILISVYKKDLDLWLLRDDFKIIFF